MLYKVIYECITDGAKHRSEFEFEFDSDTVPAHDDPYIFKLASRDSAKFYKTGAAGLKIISVSQKSAQS